MASLNSSLHIRKEASARAASRRACAPCYRNKEKCNFPEENTTCSRCSLLERTCLPRTPRRMGRPPKPIDFPHRGCSVVPLDAKKHLSKLLSPPPATVYSPNPPVPDFPEIASFLATTEAFLELHRQFMLGVNFAGDFQSVVRGLFAHAPHILGLAYSTVLELINYRRLRSDGLDGFDTNSGTRCLQYLLQGNSAVTQAKDAAVRLMLGQILLVYDALLLQTSSQIITRGALLLAKDWYPSMMRRPQLDSVTLTPILVDTLESLVRREIPVVRFPDTDRIIVDRFAGVCSSLLPLLYDLCEASYREKHRGPSETSKDLDADPYSDIEQRISLWAPRIPRDFFTKHRATEISNMLAQARVYRTSSLLVIHRLRYPIGIQDDVAQCSADTILNELCDLTHPSINAATGLGLDFPLLVAMLELPTRGERLTKSFEQLRLRKHGFGGISGFVKAVHEAYHNGYAGLWFEAVEYGLSDVMFP